MPKIYSLGNSVHALSPRIAVAALLLCVVAVVSGCAQQQPGTATGTAPVPAAPPASSSSAVATPPAEGIDLTITLTESPGATPRTFRLVANGSTPAPESTLPDSAAALAAVELHGEKMFFALPDPNRVCTEQYGGPQVAVVTGWFHGREVNASFSRTDGCEISRWTALAPLFGALAGGTGAV
ncbi:serine protease inhibitor [Arthrobacter glacialis]|uniref:serine protease inhibitor n=1 Tax=Arthrobacter glacialis TaxID=1664 RepID=UPI0026D0B7BE|nr:serine protease inhibitor [Arthrobacter glacialis]